MVYEELADPLDPFSENTILCIDAPFHVERLGIKRDCEFLS